MFSLFSSVIYLFIENSTISKRDIFLYSTSVFFQYKDYFVDFGRKNSYRLKDLFLSKCTMVKNFGIGEIIFLIYITIRQYHSKDKDCVRWSHNFGVKDIISYIFQVISIIQVNNIVSTIMKNEIAYFLISQPCGKRQKRERKKHCFSQLVFLFGT